MQKKRAFDLVLLILMLGLLWYGVFVLRGEDYYVVSLAIITIGILGFVFSFEKSRPSVALLTIIASLCALAAASRIAFFFLPQVKPIAAVVIIAGAAFGPEVGFVTGAVSAFVSNFYFGQGSWTPFQMFALGLIGFFAGLFLKKTENRIGVMLYGFFSVVLIYGGIVEINSIFFTAGEPTTAMVMAVYLSGLPFNLIFGVSTAVFLFLLYRPILKRLERLERKYRL
jgi:energy-coupling factor transport system substrate-specific component